MPDLRPDAAREALARALALADDASGAALREVLGAARRGGSAVGAAAARALADAGAAVEMALSDALLAALLAGMGRVAQSLPGVSDPFQQGSLPAATPADENALPFDVPPLPLVEAAVGEITSRRLLSHADAGQLPAEARARALAVTLQLPGRAMLRVRELLTESVASGGGMPDFRARLREEMPDGVFPRHQVEATFRDAVNTAYHGGMDRLLSTPGVGEHFPFVETLPVRDSRLSSMCALAARSGIAGTAVYRRDDPAWARLRPPRHVNCRCGANPLTAAEAARRGVAADAGRVTLPASLEKALAGARP